MKHFDTTPMHQHAGRTAGSSLTPPVNVGSVAKDRRWHLLDLARICRQRLTLRDRDIAVLRGLLSLLPSPSRPDQWVVFGSNRVLIERCDGIDERTLRRRIAHLQSCGLVARKQSPNGKRYQVRDDSATRLTYGLDLAPLFHLQSHLEALASDCAQEVLRVKALKSMIRDALFKRSAQRFDVILQQAEKSLRRVLDSTQLQEIFARITAIPVDDAPLNNDRPVGFATGLTASDGQNDRHIQSRNKESIESEEPADAEKQLTSTLRHPALRNVEQDDITIKECLDLASTATSMAVNMPQTWDDLVALSAQLAPAIGLQRPVVHAAEQQLGRYGCALAVLGLVQAFGRIRSPTAYLQALVQRRATQGLNMVRMFRSLARPPKSILPSTGCLPG